MSWIRGANLLARVILHHGKLVADDSIARLRSLMELSSLEKIFAQLAVEQDTDSMARQDCGLDVWMTSFANLLRGCRWISVVFSVSAVLSLRRDRTWRRFR